MFEWHVLFALQVLVIGTVVTSAVVIGRRWLRRRAARETSSASESMKNR